MSRIPLTMVSMLTVNPKLLLSLLRQPSREASLSSRCSSSPVLAADAVRHHMPSSLHSFMVTV